MPWARRVDIRGGVCELSESGYFSPGRRKNGNRANPVVITLTSLQLAMLCAGAAVGGAIFGVIGFAYGVLMSIFIHHAFAAPDVVFIVVGGAVVLNLALLPRF